MSEQQTDTKREPSYVWVNPTRRLATLTEMPPDAWLLHYVLALMILDDQGPPIFDDPAAWPSRGGMTPRRARAAFDWLIGHGKVKRLSDGRLEIVDLEKDGFRARRRRSREQSR